MQNASDQKKYSIGEASKFLGVSIDTLRRWEKAGKISALRSPGGHRYFLKKDLESAFGQKYSRSAPLAPTDEGKTEPAEAVSETTQETAEPELTTQPEPQPVPPQSPPPHPTTVIDPVQPETDLKPVESTQLESTPITQTIPEETFYPPSQKTADVSPGMNAKKFPLRSDFAPDEAQGEDIPGVSPRELHSEKPETSAPPDLSKKFTVEEIPSTPQNQLPDTPEEPEPKEIPTQAPEATTQSVSQTETAPQSEYLPASAPQTPQPSEPTKENVALQSQKIQASSTTSPIITQNQKGSSTLRKLSIFLLIVFLMVNIVLIGFYIFVSNQL